MYCLVARLTTLVTRQVYPVNSPIGAFGKESLSSKQIYTPNPKPENGVRLFATLEKRTLRVLPVGAVRGVASKIEYTQQYAKNRNSTSIVEVPRIELNNKNMKSIFDFDGQNYQSQSAI